MRRKAASAPALLLLQQKQLSQVEVGRSDRGGPYLRGLGRGRPHCQTWRPPRRKR